MSKRKTPELETVSIEDEVFRRLSRRRLLTGVVAAVAGGGGIFSLLNAESERGLAWPLRKFNELTDGFWKSSFNSDSRAAETPSTTKPLRINGDIGIQSEVDAGWRLSVRDPEMTEPILITLEEIKSLPSVTLSFEFKCIEGWSENVTCKGARVSDFMKKYGVGLQGSGSLSNSEKVPYAYASLTSINGEYYVSLDAKSLLHPQTLLCYEIGGQPLSMVNGYPLRLMTAVKYGVKSIKQIGAISFMSSPPADYWAERGYGEYLGL